MISTEHRDKQPTDLNPEPVSSSVGAADRRLTIFLAAVLPMIFLVLTFGPTAKANESSTSASDSPSKSMPSVFVDWLNRVSKTQAEQPHWVTPLATVTPRLEQEIRYDQFWQALPGGHSLDNYGGGKGLELIPFSPVEVILGIPAWETENTRPRKQGWADETFLVKYRILSANEQNGDYILTAFMGFSVPTGGRDFTANHYSFTPTLAFGKGWGPFDFQSTVAVSIPDNGAERTGAGTPLLLNTALQYHLLKFFWPELEANYTYWPNGKHDGLNQLLLTPGLVIGRFPIYGRLGLTLGAGVQVAVTDGPLIHRNIILSARIPF